VTEERQGKKWTQLRTEAVSKSFYTLFFIYCQVISECKFHVAFGKGLTDSVSGSPYRRLRSVAFRCHLRAQLRASRTQPLAINSNFLFGAPVREVALYDPNRTPPSWMEVIRPTQYAVFLSDVETGAEMTSEGRCIDPGRIRYCLIFDSLEESEQYCRQRVEDIPNLRCDLFDSHGRTNPPVATFVSRRYEQRLESQAKAGRMMRWAFMLIAASFPLFWYTWKTRGEGWIASFFGVQLIFIGLRLLHWGYSMKEEIRNRKAQSDLRKQQSATPTRRP